MQKFLEIVFGLGVLALLAWSVNKYFVLNDTIKKVLTAAIGVILVLWLLTLVGVL